MDMIKQKLTNSLILAFVMVLFTVGIANASPNERAEKVRVTNITWDREAQAFVVTLSAKFGIAMAGEHNSFSITTTVTIAQGANQMTVNPPDHSVERVPDAQKDNLGYIAIIPQEIGWDLIGGTVSGPSEVTVAVELKNPGGGDVGGGETSFTSTIIIELPCGDACPPTPI